MVSRCMPGAGARADGLLILPRRMSLNVPFCHRSLDDKWSTKDGKWRAASLTHAVAGLLMREAESPAISVSNAAIMHLKSSDRMAKRTTLDPVREKNRDPTVRMNGNRSDGPARERSLRIDTPLLDLMRV